MIIDSLADYTPDWQGRGPGFNPRRGHSVYMYIFAITQLYKIFLQQQGIIKMTTSKWDLERYPQFLCKN
jgi:hypothetical protein